MTGTHETDNQTPTIHLPVEFELLRDYLERSNMPELEILEISRARAPMHFLDKRGALVLYG